MWRAFYECVHKRKWTAHVVCKYCHKAFDHPSMIGTNASGNTTTSMSRHLKTCKTYEKQKPTSQTSITEYSGHIKSKKEDIRDKALKFFISGNIAFNQADNPYFHELLEAAHSKAGLTINRKILRERLTATSSKAREDLMASLIENESKVSLALDCWTSRNGFAFLGKSPSPVPLSICRIVDSTNTNHSYHGSLDR